MGTLTDSIRKALLAGNDHLEPLVFLLHTLSQSHPECGVDLQAKEKWMDVELSTWELNGQSLHLFDVFIVTGTFLISAHSN